MAGANAAIGCGGLTATNRAGKNSSTALVTGGTPISEGRRYWELRITRLGDTGQEGLLIGAVNPDTDHSAGSDKDTLCYYIFSPTGQLYGGDHKSSGGGAGGLAQGDRVGVLVDIDCVGHCAFTAMDSSVVCLHLV